MRCSIVCWVRLLGLRSCLYMPLPLPFLDLTCDSTWVASTQEWHRHRASPAPFDLTDGIHLSVVDSHVVPNPLRLMRSRTSASSVEGAELLLRDFGDAAIG